MCAQFIDVLINRANGAAHHAIVGGMVCEEGNVAAIVAALPDNTPCHRMAHIADNKKDAFGIWCRPEELQAANPGTRFTRCGVNITPAIQTVKRF